jgi:hypothetical protein
MTSLLALPVLLTLLGQAQTPKTDADPAAAAARLEFMKKAVSAHTLHPLGDPKITYRLQAEPVLRFTNTVGTAKDGAVFLWLGEADRPEAAVQIFLHRDGFWFQEFTSLSTEPLDAGPAWKPSRSGLEFQPVPGAPKPADTADQRLRQMRALTRQCNIDVHHEQKTWNNLRVLTKPLARYGKAGAGAGAGAGSKVIDGALFAYVLTTDPEAYLVLEVRQGKDGPEWQYAFAPESIYALRASWDGREVWSLPYREAWTNRNAPYYVYRFAREN